MKKTIERINEDKVIAIMRGVPPELAVDAAKALYKGGIRLLEVTYDQSSERCIEDTRMSIAAICSALGESMCIGAGTVMDTEQVVCAVEAGARYIISPNTQAEVIQKTKALNAVSIPGAFTPSEVALAYGYGADYVKLFPAGILGPAYIKAIRGALNHIPLLAVGGINSDNLNDFLALGIKGVGVGSNLVNTDLIHNRQFDELTHLARAYSRP